MSTAQETFDTVVDELLTRGERPMYIDEIVCDEDTVLVDSIGGAHYDALRAGVYPDGDFVTTLRRNLRQVATQWGLTVPAGAGW